MYRKLFVLALAAASALSVADFSPNIQETDSGLSTVFRNGPRAYEAWYDDSTLSTVSSSVQIIGVQFRLAFNANAGNIGSTWPSQTLNFTDWTMKIGSSNRLATDGQYNLPLTSSFNSYFDAGDAVTVRTGALTINTGAFVNDPNSNLSTPQPWGPTISFSTPFTYVPGKNLVFAVSHSGYSPAGETAAFFASSDFNPGVTDAIGSTVSNDLNGNPEGPLSPYVVRFVTAPVPEPATVTAVALGLVAVLRRRRK